MWSTFFVYIYILIVGMILSSVAFAQPRKEVNSLTANELQALRDGVAVMKSRNVSPSGLRNTPNFRRSWEFWANMHGHYGSTCSTDPIPSLGMSEITQWTPTNSAETEQWCKCAHKTPYFLVWHRMFLLTFERVLRNAAISANPQSAAHQNLTLPYWDIVANPQLPAAFRAPTYNKPGVGRVPNPLYTPDRAALLNSGQAVIASFIRNRAVSVLNIVSDTNNNGRVYDDFSTALEGNPHGSLHCAVSVNSTCANGLMGKLASAANDPIFWIHHANIDRLYDCWLRQRGGTNPTLADGVDPNQSFDFIYVNGTKRALTVGTLNRTLTNARVSYVQPASCAGAATSSLASAAMPASSSRSTNSIEDSEEMAEVVKSKAVGTVLVPKEESAGVSSTAAGTTASKAAGSSNIPKKKRIRLLLKGVTPDSLGRLYNVYLVSQKGKPALVGTVEFFSTAHPEGRHHGHHKNSKLDFVFDATESLEALGELPGGKLKVVLHPTTGLEFADSRKPVPLNPSKSQTSTEASAPQEKVDLKLENVSLEKTE